jgi:hypothetical protein
VNRAESWLQVPADLLETFKLLVQVVPFVFEFEGNAGLGIGLRRTLGRGLAVRLLRANRSCFRVVRGSRGSRAGGAYMPLVPGAEEA